MAEIIALRTRFAKLLAILLWCHLPVVVFVGLLIHHSLGVPILIATGLHRMANPTTP